MARPLLLLSTLAAALSLSSGALAAPTAARAAPSVRLSITALAPNASWRMRVENTGEIPFRVTADARLLSFDVLAPGAKQPVHCALPADMRPDNDVDRALVVPPKRAYAELFEPRLYCFGAAEAKAIVPGATITAHLGFGAHGTAPPFEVSGIEGVLPAVSSVKGIVADPFVLPDDPAAAQPEASEEEADPFPAHLTLEVPTQAEAWNPNDVSVPVTVTNRGRRPVTFMLRHETIGFDVIGANGLSRCEWGSLPPAPVREIFTTLAPGARQTVSLLLTSVCTGTTFDQAGLFLVRPRLDTRRAGGEKVGLRTFDGEVTGASTMALRIHRGRAQEGLKRPRLEAP